MKKLSFSLFAVVAILFAVASAFTTDKQGVTKKSSLTPDFFLVVASGASDIQANFMAGQFSDYNVIGNYVAGTTDAATWGQSAVDPLQSTTICDGSGSYVCSFN